MIFFDIDGTLIDHKRAEMLGVKGFYNEYGECFDINEDSFYTSWCKISDMHFLRFLNGDISFAGQRIERVKDVFRIAGIELTDYEANERFITYRKIYELNLLPYDDVVPCLESLSGERLGIISNGDMKQQMFKLEKIGLKRGFDPIIVAGDVGVAKPSKEIFMKACIMSNTNIKDCIYVGDDYNTDILSCQSAGMKGIWINRKEELTKYPETRVISNLAELNCMLY